MNLPLFDSAGPLCFGTAERKTMEDIETPDYPGPGAHQQVIFNKVNPPTWKFANDQDRNSFLCLITRDNPAPDNYQLSVAQTQYKFPQYSIPKAKNFAQKPNQNSRYNYDPNNELAKPHYPEYTFGYAEEIKYDTDVPPPNNYFQEPIEQKTLNKKQHHFTKAPRPNPYGQQAKFPGVGQYEVSPQQKKKEGYSIGKSARPDPSNGKSPPRYYEIANDMTQIGTAKTQGKYFPIHQNKEKYGFPSATYYTVKRPKSGRNVITFSSQRSKMHNTMTVKNPSADKYANPLNISKYSMSKSQSFAKSKRPILRVQESPSPNQYDLDNPEFRFNQTCGKMGSKIKQLKKFITPSGANYDPQEKLTRPQPQRVINYYSHRTDFSRSSTGKKIGPGSYVNQEQWKKSQKGKMDRSDKLLLKDNKQPGPGYYNISGTIGVLPRYYRLPKKIFSDGTLNEQNLQDPSIQKHKETMKTFLNSLDQFSKIKKKVYAKKEKQSLARK